MPIIEHSQLRHVRWGLVPAWADDSKIGNSLLNARAETVAEKPAFRGAFKHGRCVIVTDGFYEWRKVGDAKQPYFIHLKTDRPFTFAGLTEHWQQGEQTIDSATIITTVANELMSDLHERMPVILGAEARRVWLDPTVNDSEELLGLLKPYPAAEMSAYPVSSLVNSPRNDVPQCLTEVKSSLLF